MKNFLLSLTIASGVFGLIILFARFSIYFEEANVTIRNNIVFSGIFIFFFVVAYLGLGLLTNKKLNK